MENLILTKEDIKMMAITMENEKFLTDNELRIKGCVSYECVLVEPKKELGNRQAITLQGKPGGSLSKISFAKINFGRNDQGKEITPFGVIFFEEGGK
jgi:hypothetical protein